MYCDGTSTCEPKKSRSVHFCPTDEDFISLDVTCRIVGNPQVIRGPYGPTASC